MSPSPRSPAGSPQGAPGLAAERPDAVAGEAATGDPTSTQTVDGGLYLLEPGSGAQPGMRLN